MSKCKRQFETSEKCVLYLQQWNNLVAANTEVEFEKQLKELSNAFDMKF